MDMSLSTDETVLLEEGQESGGEYQVAGRKAIRAGVYLVTDQGTLYGKGYQGQWSLKGDHCGVLRRQGKVLLSLPANSDQLETKWWF